MTNKANFTSDEWKVLLESVMAAGIAITSAEPHGLWGLLKPAATHRFFLMRACPVFPRCHAPIDAAYLR
jgi:hypothetical protein